MTRTRCRPLLAAVLVLWASLAAPARAQQLPARLTDREFWQLVTEFSEPNGYFNSDNLLSNEGTYQYAIPDLIKVARPGGVYLGVGPEQNFAYIVALQPRMAFIFDIRRGNLLEHLLYKALFELSATRAEFVSRLFSHVRPAGLDTATTAEALFRAYAGEPTRDVALFRKNLGAVTERLVAGHGFALSADDLKGIEFIYSAFFNAGPDLDYNYPNPSRGGYARGGPRPTYADLMTANDSYGSNRGFLASEASYRSLKSLETNNLLVPVVGDFAGPKAIRAVGTYVREHAATVSAFYTSNVEQYLFRQGDDWSRYYTNVGTLPLDSTSTFIRAVFNSGFRMVGLPPNGSVTMLCSMTQLVKAFNERRIGSYNDVVQMSK